MEKRAMEGWDSHRKQTSSTDNSVGMYTERSLALSSLLPCSLLLLRQSFLAASWPPLFFLMKGCLQ